MFRPCFETLESREVFSNVVSAPTNVSEQIGKSQQPVLIGMVDAMVSGVRVAVGDFNGDGRLDLIKEGAGTLALKDQLSANAVNMIMGDGSVRWLNGTGVQGTGALKAMDNVPNNHIDDMIGWDFLSPSNFTANLGNGLLPYVEQDNLYKIMNALPSKPNAHASVTDLVIDPFQQFFGLLGSQEYYRQTAMKSIQNIQ